MKSLFAFSLLALLFLTSCEKERLTANGNVTTETRTLTAFTGVHTSGSSAVHVVYGTTYQVTIKGSSNLIPAYESTVVNGKLSLNYKHVNVKKDDLEITVTMPLVKNVSLSGSATIDLTGNFNSPNLIELLVSGSGAIKLNNNLAAAQADLNVSGSGAIRFEKLVAINANATVSGSGDAYVSASEKLNATISGSGKIYYGGNPLLETHISGSGKVVKL